jgi:hypothetical protein
VDDPADLSTVPAEQWHSGHREVESDVDEPPEELNGIHYNLYMARQLGAHAPHVAEDPMPGGGACRAECLTAVLNLMERESLLPDEEVEVDWMCGVLSTSRAAATWDSNGCITSL